MLELNLESFLSSLLGDFCDKCAEGKPVLFDDETDVWYHPYGPGQRQGPAVNAEEQVLRDRIAKHLSHDFCLQLVGRKSE